MIIGSHDSGMSIADHCIWEYRKNTITQYFSVFKQAENGARYFDVRPDFDHNE
ncbi:hypothetical protein IB633_03815 [Francisella philomiragia]|uniref:hypothetical protein n=1 Tax=Francisella philomiragia TaxID=28110 RepID=UPI000323B248|nr:hypothetical protein [Francisella philomiragia]AJI47988.1 exo-1,3-beta-D-glucanase domain protein [Francisella philomiragia]AJI49348.1 hypothetical protein KU46_554 [Francisella philomiragia]MBK2020523.1 hypothetical protein [Francisella philomiragia]MBK2030216.1 hypothetical protein [Francisella philomiragia]MBK2264822.1 hypothetical protein [Francisella philomiragia]